MSAAAEKIAFLRASLAQAEPQGQARMALGHPAADACLHGGILRGALHEVFPATAGNEAAAGGFAAALAGRVAEGKRILWLRPDFAALEHGEISARGLIELGLDPARFLLLRAPDATSVLRAAADALSCAALGALVIEIPGSPRILDLSASRRLVLTAAQSGVTAFLLRLDAEAEPSAAETRWLIRAARSQTAPLRPFGPPPPCWGRKEKWGGGKLVTGASLSSPVRGRCPPRVRPEAGPRINSGAEGDWGGPRFEAELARNRHGRTGHWVMEWSCDDCLFRAADSGAVVSAPSDRPAAAANRVVA